MVITLDQLWGGGSQQSSKLEHLNRRQADQFGRDKWMDDGLIVNEEVESTFIRQTWSQDCY